MKQYLVFLKDGKGEPQSEAQYHPISFLSGMKPQLQILAQASSRSATFSLIKSQISGKGKKEAVQQFADTVNQLKLYKIIAQTCGIQIGKALKLMIEPSNLPLVFFCSHGS